MADERVLKEWMEMQRNPEPGFSAGPVEEGDLRKWQALVMGPGDSLYEGGAFSVSIYITDKYPFEAPKVKFETKIFHPNIDSKGNICLDILKKQWTPALGISSLLISILSLLSEPNHDDPLNVEVAKVYRASPGKFEATALEWTQLHAMGW